MDFKNFFCQEEKEERKRQKEAKWNEGKQRRRKKGEEKEGKGRVQRRTSEGKEQATTIF